MDIFWGPGFVIAATWYLLSSEGYEPPRVMIISLMVIWGFCLADSKTRRRCNLLSALRPADWLFKRK
jgi:steroid 5-alpha reductase family enzyme